MQETSKNTAIVITTYNRGAVLYRALQSIAALGLPMLVVDDGSRPDQAQFNQEICAMYRAQYMRIAENRGLACALNIGLSYWLADARVEWISYLQDDVDVHPLLMAKMFEASEHYRCSLYTGHNSPYHQAASNMNGYLLKKSCAGVHMHARSAFWKSILPIPTFSLGAPKRIDGRIKGLGSNVDWWIVRDSPQSTKSRGEQICCVPNLVRTFLFKAEDSSWGNALPKGEEPPLAAIS
jgi:glycosyltransferase involved in cell wall biosynthesis